MRKCYAKVRHGIPAVHHAKFPAQLATSTECEVPRAEIASVLIKEKRRRRFSPLDLSEQIPSSGRSQYIRLFS